MLEIITSSISGSGSVGAGWLTNFKQFLRYVLWQDILSINKQSFKKNCGKKLINYAAMYLERQNKPITKRH